MTTTLPSVPAPRAVPPFEPLRVRGARHRLRRALRRGWLAPALLLALAAGGGGGGGGAGAGCGAGAA
ncbi:hypothetical protein AB0424_30455, partial [Streptomyces sp. NPDC051180]